MRGLRAVWNHDGRKLLVVLQEKDALFGEEFVVYVFDEQRHLVRKGNFYSDHAQPYGLVEVRGNDPALPAPYKDRWILGIETWQEGQTYDPTKPVTPAFYLESPPNAVGVEPVEWDDIPQKFEFAAGRLVNAENMKWRNAEAQR
ncbi:MAG TPA: hypothetical protein VFE47_20530 [Tepidisphaeraceae bacterium]|jgi:hypothetical protein|nr:hypothetical protein [Tepidisphaeraceae bacterium]